MHIIDLQAIIIVNPQTYMLTQNGLEFIAAPGLKELMSLKYDSCRVTPETVDPIRHHMHISCIYAITKPILGLHTIII